MTPEEIFEMFFGGGFPSGSVYRRRGHYFHAREAHAQQEERVIQTVAWVFNIGWIVWKFVTILRWFLNPRH